MVIVGNTIHTSTLNGIETSHTTGINITGNNMDGVNGKGIWISGNVDTKPTIVGNTVLSTAIATSQGIFIQNTPDAFVASNYSSGAWAFAITADSTSPRATITGNWAGNPSNAGAVVIYAQGAQATVSNNTLYVSLGIPGLRIAQANSRAVNNTIFVAASGASPIFVNSTCNACTVESNQVYFISGTGFGITEQASATNDVFRRNVVVGGTSTGWSLSGTTPLNTENSFNGAVSATVVSSMNVGTNAVIPASVTGTQGTGAALATATGAFTNGNLRSTNAAGTEIDSGVIANRTLSQGIGCGTTTTCANSIPTAPKFVYGQAPLVGGTATVTGISPAFTSTTSSNCACADLSGTTNGCKAIVASTTSITLNGNGTDTISYVCTGN